MFPIRVLTDITISLAVTATVGFLLVCIYLFMKNKGTLPGPRGFPYLGLWPFLQHKTCHQQLAEYGKKYGDLYSFTMTGRLLIHLGSVKAIREVHGMKAAYFAEKYDTFNLMSHVLEEGVIMINGESWKVLRKFFIHTVKEYGLTFRKNDMIGPIYDSLNRTIQELESRKEIPFNVVNLLTEQCAWTLRKVLFGEDGISDELMHSITAAHAIAVEEMTGVNMIMMGPFARLVYLISPSHRRAMKMHHHIADIVHNCAKKVESSMNYDNPTCFIEHYYAERNARRKKSDPTWKYFTDKSLVTTIVQFVGDGILGAASFIAMFLNALREHPEEQDKIYAELLEIVGPSRQPVIEDKNNLPYTNAFMNEVIRSSPFFPLMPSLECTKETTVRGYRIPKGAITLLNFWAANTDPGTYEDPEKFNPSRFLSMNGKREELPVLFGVGKRSCSGEAFIVTQAFLFFTTIVKNFRIIVDSGDSSITAADFLMSGELELRFRSRSGT